MPTLRFLFLLLVFGLSNLLSSEAYTQKIEAEMPFFVKGHYLMEDGSYLLAGSKVDQANIYDHDHAALVAWHPQKGVLWEKSYGSKVVNKLVAIDVFPNGDIAVAGGSISMSNGMYILGADGSVKKEITFPMMSTIYDIEIVGNDLILGGFIFGEDGKLYGAMKIDQKGKLLWAAELREGDGTPVDDFVRQVIPFSDGYYLAGTSDREMVLIAIDQEGNERWRENLDDYYSETNGAILHSSGNVWVTGQGSTKNDDDPKTGGVFVACVSPEGKSLWKRAYESSRTSSGEGLVEEKDGNVQLLARMTASSTASCMIELSAEGTEIQRLNGLDGARQLFGIHSPEMGEYFWFQVDNINAARPDNTRFGFRLK